MAIEVRHLIAIEGSLAWSIWGLAEPCHTQIGGRDA